MDAVFLGELASMRRLSRRRRHRTALWILTSALGCYLAASAVLLISGFSWVKMGASAAAAYLASRLILECLRRGSYKASERERKGAEKLLADHLAGRDCILASAGVVEPLPPTSAAIGGRVPLAAPRFPSARLSDVMRASRSADLERPRSWSMHDLQQLTGQEFEQVVAARLLLDGVLGVRVVGGPNDRGADIVGEWSGGEIVIVQCKRYQSSTKINSRDMQMFAGVAFTLHNANVPIYITTSSFTRQGVGVAGECNIHLLGGTQVLRWLAGNDSFLQCSLQAPPV